MPGTINLVKGVLGKSQTIKEGEYTTVVFINGHSVPTKVLSKCLRLQISVALRLRCLNRRIY